MEYEKTNGLLDQRSILSVLEDGLRQQGFVGSTDLPKLVYLSLLTRFFERPVSLVIKGPSGSGKSYSLNAAVRLAPAEAFEAFSGMSEKALPYMGELDLQHRYLVIGEAAGLAEGAGRTFLRQLLSEGTVRYVTVVDSPSGHKARDLKPIKGPIGLIMTTTANALHPEDENRMLSYPVDESSERIKEALVSQARGRRSERQPIDAGPWHALHRFVGAGNLSVDIPYDECLANRMPNSHFRVMRDFPHLISLIQAHALMHQCTREQGRGSEVLATLDDYRAVHDLVAKPLAYGLEAAVPEPIRTVVEAVEALEKDHDVDIPFEARGDSAVPRGVSQVQLSEALGRDQSVISRNVRKAIGQGFLRNLNPGQGKEARLVMGDKELPSGTVLPTPEELQDELTSWVSPVTVKAD